MTIRITAVLREIFLRADSYAALHYAAPATTALAGGVR